MKKRILSLFCLLLCLPLCAGCADHGTVSSSPPPSSASPTPALPKDPKAGRTLVWNDEFDGNTLDNQKWGTGFTMTTGGSQKTDAKHIAVKDGNLVLTSTYTKLGGCQTPAALLTQGKMSFTYGYVEMRAILPFKHGAWPSFWMKSEIKDAKWMAEYDILEVFSDSRYMEFNLHKWSNSTGGDHTQLNPMPRGYTFPASAKPWEEYHLYAMEWTPDTISFLVDGVVKCKAVISELSPYRSWGADVGLNGMDGFHDSAYLILNNSVITDQNYASWMKADWKAEKEDYPFTYQVDYIRLYQKDGETLNVN